VRKDRESDDNNNGPSLITGRHLCYLQRDQTGQDFRSLPISHQCMGTGSEEVNSWWVQRRRHSHGYRSALGSVGGDQVAMLIGPADSIISMRAPSASAQSAGLRSGLRQHWAAEDHSGPAQARDWPR
jgi:hypothetical protein